MEKKYEFTGETVVAYDRILHHIRALRDIPVMEVKKGDTGGWIEKEENLSHSGDCWVTGNGKVFDNAVVCDNAKVYDNAVVWDYAYVSNNAIVCDNAEVFDRAMVGGDSVICGTTNIRGGANIVTGTITRSEQVVVIETHTLSKDITFYKVDNIIYVASWWFDDTLDEFKSYVEDTKDDDYNDVYTWAINSIENYPLWK